MPGTQSRGRNRNRLINRDRRAKRGEHLPPTSLKILVAPASSTHQQLGEDDRR